MRVMGLDVGDRRIGVALSDPSGFLASPVTTVERTGGKRDVATVITLATEHEAELIVVGLPRLLSGEIGEQARKTMQFAEKLSQQTRIPVVLWDERFSSATADELMGQAGRSAAERRARIDAAAAAVILQSYLDQKPSRHEPQAGPA